MGRANALRTLVAIAVACAVAVLSCGCKPKTASPPPLPKLQPPPDPVDQAKVGALVDGHAAFGWAMLEEITGQAPEENVFISPTSIALALSMTLNGASGTTRDAMLAALQFEGLTADEINAAGAQLMASLAEAEPAIALSIANSLWARDGISFVPEFIDINRTYYGARVSTLDFGAREAAKTINEWVAARTRDKIDRIVDDPIDPTAILFLINAIYFKGEWDEPFEEHDTRDRSFTLIDGTEVTVPLMSRWGEYPYLETEAFQVVRLAYKDHRVGMYVFLPGENSNLAELAAELTPESWDAWMEQFSDREGHVKLPRFTLEYEKSLKETLSALGMEQAFSGDAQFAGMTEMPAFIQDVKHKTFVEVNEEGTEAAAATSVEMMGEPEPPFEMVVNRPFFCAIVDQDTGSVLFAGYVVDPT